MTVSTTSVRCDCGERLRADINGTLRTVWCPACSPASDPRGPLRRAIDRVSRR